MPTSLACSLICSTLPDCSAGEPRGTEISLVTRVHPSLVTFYCHHIRKNKMLQLKLERRGENEAAVDRSTESEAKIRKESLDINANVVSSGPCFFCGQQSTLLCRFCQGVYYCSEVTSRDCQLKYKDSLCFRNISEYIGQTSWTTAIPS